jgi:hypothetical protein
MSGGRYHTCTAALARLAADDTTSCTPHTRGFHSSTLRLNVSTFRGIRWVHD